MKFLKSRRSFLRKVSLSGFGIGLASAGCETIGEDWDFSFVHLTDMHVRRKRRGHEGYAACVESVNNLEEQPDMVLMGGDMAFDGMYTLKDEYLDQLDLVKSLSDQLNMPYYPCIGNHDTFGLSPRRQTAADDPDIGKGFFKNIFDLESTYYSFDHKGWHFVILDSMEQVEAVHGPSQTHQFGKEQLEWLRFDLGRNHKMPTVIVTHVAAFNNIGQINADPDLSAMNHMVVKDTREFREIIERHKVKLVLQGHSHIPDAFQFNDIWYFTSQSVSAAWWGGNWKGFGPGYTQFFIKGDALTWERKAFNWTHHLEPEDDLERERISEREVFENRQKKLWEEEVGL